MFYQFLLPLQDHLSALRLFKYISFRSLFAAMTALVFVLVFGQMMIRWLQKLKFGESIRELGPQTHKAKAGTPTMGGIMILSAILFSVALWGNFYNKYLWVVMIATMLLGAVGFADDYIKSIKKKKAGLPGRLKLLFQTLIALGVALFLYYFPSNPKEATTLYIPFINGSVLDLGHLWIAFAVFVIVSFSNAVNLTDGLDGLAIGLILIVAITIGVIVYLTGNIKVAAYLRIPYIPNAAELTVFIAALSGAALGFLWFNANPASVFMGDTGSLALGGLIGVIALMVKKEFLLVILGGIFVAEAASVVIQVFVYKWKKKRVFKMAPLHHHFELCGWAEQKVVARFVIVGIILALISLSTLKIL
jgi:phospho-N-acetylmuramoyl-pentapeptide-transferase